jgi:hypothetical protein
VICLERVCSPVKTDNCNHIFCRRCFEVYTKKFSKCPTCKKEFNSYDDIFKKNSINYQQLKIINFQNEDRLYRLCHEKIKESYCVICHKTDNKEFFLHCARCFFNEVHYNCDNWNGLVFGVYICPICHNSFYNNLKKK